jgi:hypothetical protein
MGNDGRWSGIFDRPDRFVFLFGKFPVVLFYVWLSVFGVSLVVDMKLFAMFFIDITLD